MEQTKVKQGKEELFSKHIKLSAEEIALIVQEQRKMGINNISQMGRILIRKALGLME